MQDVLSVKINSNGSDYDNADLAALKAKLDEGYTYVASATPVGCTATLVFIEKIAGKTEES
jgi:hypothetical protein